VGKVKLLPRMSAIIRKEKLAYSAFRPVAKVKLLSRIFSGNNQEYKLACPS